MQPWRTFATIVVHSFRRVSSNDPQWLDIKNRLILKIRAATDVDPNVSAKRVFCLETVIPKEKNEGFSLIVFFTFLFYRYRFTSCSTWFDVSFWNLLVSVQLWTRLDKHNCVYALLKFVHAKKDTVSQGLDECDGKNKTSSLAIRRMCLFLARTDCSDAYLKVCGKCFRNKLMPPHNLV